MHPLPNQVADAIEKPYEFRFGDYISNGFKIIQNNVGLFIVFALVFFTIMVISQFIPLIGPLAGSFILSPCLMAGFYLAAKKSEDHEPLEFNDFFKGFDFMGPLALVVLIQTVLIIAAMIPFFIAMFTTIGASAMMGDGEPNFSPFIILIAFVFIIPIIYLTISWSFAPLLVVFHKMEAWEAMEASRKIVSKQWWVFLAFAIVSGLIAGSGVVALGIGLLFTVPAAMAMTFSAFRDIVGLPGQENGEDPIDHFLVD